MRQLVGEFLMELVSTFVLAFIAAMSYGDSIIIAALAVGLGAAVLVSSERTHMNPVISIAIALCDTCTDETPLQFGFRIIAQLFGSAIAGVSGIGIRNDVLSFADRAGSNVGKCLTVELIFSYLLVLVVLRTRNSHLGAYAHGLCYFIAILCGQLFFEGNALINPMVAVGLMFGSSVFNRETNEGHVWLYVVGPLVGCLLSVAYFLVTEWLSPNYTIVEMEDTSEGYSDDETKEWVSGSSKKKIAQPYNPRPSDGVVPLKSAMKSRPLKPAIKYRGADVDNRNVSWAPEPALYTPSKVEMQRLRYRPTANGAGETGTARAR